MSQFGFVLRIQVQASDQTLPIAGGEAARIKDEKKAQKAAAQQEAKDKKKAAADLRKQENAEKREIMQKGRKAASLASKVLPALTDICKAIPPVLQEATAEESAFCEDHPQILSLNEGLKELDEFRKAASATLSAQAKCSGKPLPLLPFETEKFISTKIKGMKDQLQALKLLMHPPKRPSRRRNAPEQK